ncbi:MAG: glycoside hydrolase family 3 N-terminal domain-containing protein [Edaphocola sp.]
MNKRINIFCALLLLPFAVAAQQFPFKNKWVDSVYDNMNETERLGQLFMVAAYSGGENANETHILELVKRGQIGGVIFMQGTPEAQAKMTNKIQAAAHTKLLIGMDAEWGLGMRLKGVANYPRQMMIGATQDSALMYQIGSAIAAQCRRLGVHIDFAPVVDVNNNPKNPVINFRSFGDDKELVSKLGIAYMHGLQNNGVMACAKHFPGHGDVAIDSHLDVPIIKKSKAELEQTELYPFEKLIAAGVQSMMIAHLSVPALDDQPKVVTTISKKVVTDLLKNELKFGGLIFTDALNMKGLTKNYPDGETDLLAFLAGNDMLLFSQNVPLAISKIQWAITTGKISKEEVERRVRKILAAKYDAGLCRYSPIKESKVTEDLNAQTNHLKEKTARAAITLMKDQHGHITKLKAAAPNVAYININGAADNKLATQLRKKYKGLSQINIPANTKIAALKNLIDIPDNTGTVIVGLHDLSLYPGKSGSFGLDATQLTALKQLSTNKKCIFAVMGNAYAAKPVCNAGSILVAYEDDEYTEEAAFEVLTGSLKPEGKLPVKPCK